MTQTPLVVLHSSDRWLRQTKTWIYQQIRWLPASIEAHVVCNVTENLEQFPIAHLHALEAAGPSRRLLEAVARRARLGVARFPTRVARKTGAKILHSHFGPAGYRELSVARAAKLRHVVTFYGYDVTRLPALSPLWSARYLQLFSSVDRVLCEGPHMRKELLALGCPAHKAHVQHLGADLSLIRYQPRRWSKGEPVKVLIAGSFREKKGIPYALSALTLLLRAKPELELSVEIVGGAGSSPAEQRELRAIQAAAAPLGARVAWLGYRPYNELIERAYAAHIFVSPSVRAADGDTEGGAPVTIVELAASGMPIVSTRHCDIPNVLTGPAAEFLAAERDAEDLCARLSLMLDEPTRWPQLLEATRGHIAAHFDAAAQGKALAAHYQELALPSSPR